MTLLLRQIVKDLGFELDGGHITPLLVSGVFKFIGNYVNFANKKHMDRALNGVAISEIPGFGIFYRFGSACTEFVPGSTMQTIAGCDSSKTVPTEHITVKRALPMKKFT